MMSSRFIYSSSDDYNGIKVLGKNYTTSWMQNVPIYSGKKPVYEHIGFPKKYETNEENKIETKLSGGKLHHKHLDKHDLNKIFMKGHGILRL